MRTSLSLASVLSVAMMFNPVFSDGVRVFVRSCKGLASGELDAAETITFMRRISCQERRVMHIERDLILRSHAVIDTMNVHFNVHRGATLTLHAPGMTIARDQGSTVPLFDVSGVVTLEATGSTLGLTDGSLEDDEGVVVVTDGGTVESKQRIRYGADSVNVYKKAGPGVKLGVSPREEVDLKAQPEGVASYSPSSSYSTPSSSSSTTPSISSSSSPPKSGDSESGSNFAFLNSYFDAPGGPGVGRSAQFNHAPIETEATNEPDENRYQPAANADNDGITDGKSGSASPIASPTPTFTPRSDPISIPSPASSSGDNGYLGRPSNPASGSATATPNPSILRSSNPPPSPSSHDSSSHGRRYSHGGNSSPTSKHRSSSSPGSPGSTGSPGSPDSQRWDSDDDRSGSRSNSRTVVDGAKLAMKVGEVRQPPFLSGSGKSIVWPAEDGSVMFRKISEASPNFFTGSEGKERKVTTVIVAPDAGRLKRVLKARMALRKETQEGSASGSKKGKWGAWGWVPWGRQHRQDVDRARGHVGEVTMTLDDRACLEVTVDGICVVSKSGPHKREWRNRFPWRRRKSDEYELYVTEEGIDVQLAEKTVWGVTAADMMG